MYVDKTDCFEDLVGFNHITLENCKGTGSSLFIKTLASFLDKSIDTKDIFSKDFPGTEISHNSTMSHIISDYLKNVQDVESIDLEAMYNNYIAKWNADIWEDTYDSFKNCSILSFVVIMDTLDAILENRSITNNSLMLSDNKELWYMLSDCRCWAELNDVIVKARYGSKLIDSAEPPS